MQGRAVLIGRERVCILCVTRTDWRCQQMEKWENWGQDGRILEGMYFCGFMNSLSDGLDECGRMKYSLTVEEVFPLHLPTWSHLEA